MKQRQPTAEPIRNLLEGLKGDRSWRQLVDDCGGNPTRAYLQRAISEPPEQLPTVAQIEGLSRGLKVNASAIVLTWGIGLGLWGESTWGSPSTQSLDGWGDLTSSQQTAVNRIVHELGEANKES